MSPLLKICDKSCFIRNVQTIFMSRPTAQGSKDTANPQQVPTVEEKIFTDDELNTLIDPILQSDDLNKDGFIDYPEFIRAQQKSAAANNDESR
jgi:hypothetical protein